MAANDSRPPVTGYPAPPSYSNGHAQGHAYPYAAPPPQYNNYQYYPPPQRRPTFLRYLIVAIIAFFIITGTILFIVWLVLRPQLPEFRVNSITVTNFSVPDSDHVSGTWQIRFLVNNPNKRMKISYATLNSALFYKSEVISETRISPFDQGTRNETTVETTLTAVDAYVAESAVNKLNSDRNRGSVNFGIRILSWVRFSSGWWRARTRRLDVWCSDLTMGLSTSSNGTAKFSGAPRKCVVSL